MVIVCDYLSAWKYPLCYWSIIYSTVTSETIGWLKEDVSIMDRIVLINFSTVSNKANLCIITTVWYQ